MSSPHTPTQQKELLRVRRFAQLTLPEEFRERFGVKEGDYIQAEMTGRGMVLRPVSIVRHDRAWQDVFSSMKKVRAASRTRAQSPRLQEEYLATAIKNERKKKRR